MNHEGVETRNVDHAPPSADPWLSVRQAAQHVRVCEKTVRRAYLARQIQYTRVGRAVRFRRSWLDEWLLKQQVTVIG